MLFKNFTGVFGLALTVINNIKIVELRYLPVTGNLEGDIRVDWQVAAMAESEPASATPSGDAKIKPDHSTHLSCVAPSALRII